MATIFHDAAGSLQELQTPLRRPSSNTKRFRMPSSQAQCLRFGSINHDVIRNFLEAEIPPELEPDTQTSFNQAKIVCNQRLPSLLSNCDTTPKLQLLDSFDKDVLKRGLVTPVLGDEGLGSTAKDQACSTMDKTLLERKANITPSLGSDDAECHSTHGVPFLIPISVSEEDNPHKANINAWLDEVFVASPEVASMSALTIVEEHSRKTPLAPPSFSLRSPEKVGLSISKNTASSTYPKSQTSSNKENIQPSKLPLASSMAGVQYSTPISSKTRFSRTTPSRSSSATPNLSAMPPLITSPRALGSASRFHHPETPRGHLTRPAKCKKPRVNGGKECVSVNPAMAHRSSSFTIHNDEADDSPTLSPNVERHRKGRGPKRGRCPSYFDRDVLGDNSPSAKMLAEDEGVKDSVLEINGGRQILGESMQGKWLMKADTFVEGVEEADSSFVAGFEHRLS
ncbi:hypothetical protein MMC12_002789 [Toensbergia leucococca]|nr:hypothetical protein [Toensbergia leucococca]